MGYGKSSPAECIGLATRELDRDGGAGIVNDLAERAKTARVGPSMMSPQDAADGPRRARMALAPELMTTGVDHRAV
ncbi:hypothetical protein FRAHR75_640038 [Frankia sp. Hr75.2]|nr:hypothetical protein FRAHR75_640038 [Frankia sp. Hr75.2]